jgi:hypothetical protein
MHYRQLLTGTYVGQCWFEQLSTDTWTITQDTEYVYDIELSRCWADLKAGCVNWAAQWNFYTTYTYCNSAPPTNQFALFHDFDSLTFISDSNVSNPFWSVHFYGKRISLLTDINDKGNNQQLKIYPVPATETLTIETPQKTIIEILNIEGQSIMTTAIVDRKTIIDLEGLSSGVYIIKATTDKGVVIKKIIIAPR